MPATKRKPPRCPKCGTLPESYYEEWDGFSIHFDADSRGIPAPEGYLREGGPSGRVDAVCPRGHRWRLRGHLQITALRPPNIQEC